MEESSFHQELAEMLRGQGHSEEEIAKILAHVSKYELETRTDSVMDSIAKGSFNIAAIVEEALGKAEPDA
jgi:predicted transcriptional regulator